MGGGVLRRVSLRPYVDVLLAVEAHAIIRGEVREVMPFAILPLMPDRLVIIIFIIAQWNHPPITSSKIDRIVTVSV